MHLYEPHVNEENRTPSISQAKSNKMVVYGDRTPKK